jgi:hypothetical protein
MDCVNKQQELGVRPHPWIVRRDLSLLTPDLHDFSDLVGSGRHAGRLRRIAAVAAILVVCALASEEFVSTSRAPADIASARAEFSGGGAP